MPWHAGGARKELQIHRDLRHYAENWRRPTRGEFLLLGRDHGRLLHCSMGEQLDVLHRYRFWSGALGPQLACVVQSESVLALCCIVIACIYVHSGPAIAIFYFQVHAKQWATLCMRRLQV